jgi:hypothetical protein
MTLPPRAVVPTPCNEPNITCMTYREYRRQHALDDLAFAIAHRRAVYRPFLNDVHESGRSNVRAKLKELEKFYAKQRARIEEALAPTLSNLKESS